MVDETNSLEIIPQMQPGEDRTITLENAKGDVIEEVSIENPTDSIIPVQEALITQMVIKNSSNVDLQFPEGICFDATQEEILFCQPFPMLQMEDSKLQKINPNLSVFKNTIRHPADNCYNDF